LVLEGGGPDVSVKTPVVIFVIAIVLSAYVGGLAPGLLATVLSTLAAYYFILPPAHAWLVADPLDNLKWITLAGAGTLISFLMAHRERSPAEPVAPYSRQAASLLLSAERKVRSGFAALLFCLIAIAAVSYPALVRLREDTARVDHTHQVIAALRLLVSSATDAETNVRGYIITGNEGFLEPYQSALQRVNHALSEVRRLTNDEPEQQRRLDRLEPIVAERLAALKGGIERRRQGLPLALGGTSGRGAQLQVQVRAGVAEMEATEQALLVQREALEQRAGAVAKIEVVGGSALAVLIVAAALWMIGKAFTASRGAETALEESRDQLEIRVNERTSELRTSEQRIAGIISSAMDAVITVDEGQRIVLFNPAAEKLFGCAASEALGHPLERFIPERCRSAHAEHVLRFGQSGTAHKPMSGGEEMCGLRADGTEFPIEASISQARVGQQKVFTVILRDITQRKRTEEALVQRAQELARSNADLAQFAYVAAHDLKEPLRAVSGCVGLLKRHYEGKLDEQAEEYMAHAVGGTVRMESLIDGLLAFSRVGSRGGELQRVECAQAMGIALQNLAATIQESGAVVTQDPLPAVNGDLPQLVSVFQNLIGNAIKFRKEAPPRIHVSAERNGTHWHLSVRDNGIGIAPQYFERIFGVFQRLHTRREYPGTGIGLAICKKIVERHGGRIWVESAPGEGATFNFSLPATPINHLQREREFHA
jgi:PAS domain S-box-containing protein